MREQRDPLDDRRTCPVERRQSADRRAGWRGGRRDTDWTSRPAAELAVPMAPAAWWRRLLGRSETGNPLGGDNGGTLWRLLVKGCS